LRDWGGVNALFGLLVPFVFVKCHMFQSYSKLGRAPDLPKFL